MKITQTNRSGLRRALAVCLVAGGCFAAVPPAAHAQNETVFRPTAPAPAKSGKPPLMRSMLLLIVLGGLAVGAQTIPSKRGHQD